MPILLLDVSHWQGVMDWNVAKSRGVRGAIIKASDGTTWRDAQFKRNVAECRRLGIAWGAYHYFYPTMSAVDQAKNFMEAMMGYAPDLGVWGDFEQPLATGSTLDVSALAKSFMEYIDNYYSAGIYTSPGYAKYTLKNAAWMKSYPLWIANYDVASPTIPLPWTEAVLWQYSSKGTGYGSDGYIDLNNFMRPDSEWEAFGGFPEIPIVIEPPVIEPPVVVGPIFTAEDKSTLDKISAWMIDHVKGF